MLVREIEGRKRAIDKRVKTEKKKKYPIFFGLVEDFACVPINKSEEAHTTEASYPLSHPQTSKTNKPRKGRFSFFFRFRFKLYTNKKQTNKQMKARHEREIKVTTHNNPHKQTHQIKFKMKRNKSLDHHHNNHHHHHQSSIVRCIFLQIVLFYCCCCYNDSCTFYVNAATIPATTAKSTNVDHSSSKSNNNKNNKNLNNRLLSSDVEPDSITFENDAYELRQVHVITRHGSRFPTTSTTSSSTQGGTANSYNKVDSCACCIFPHGGKWDSSIF